MEIILQKFVKYIVCMSGGLLLAFETTLLFFVPCLLAIILDRVCKQPEAKVRVEQ